MEILGAFNRLEFLLREVEGDCQQSMKSKMRGS